MPSNQDLNHKIEYTLGQLIVLEQFILAVARQCGPEVVSKLREELLAHRRLLPSDSSPQSDKLVESLRS